MKNKSFIALLFVAALLLKGTCAYAQGISTDNYAWRLDGIRLNTVVHESKDGSYLGTQVDDVNYFYAADSMTETYTQIHYNNATDQYYRLNPYSGKYVYRDFGEEGKHTVYLYNFPMRMIWNEENLLDSSLNISDLQKVDEAAFELNQRYDYAYDTYRNIFDEEGHLIRQIRNYDYSVYRLDSAGNWLPSMRYYHTETDSTLESISYYFNTKEQKWKNQWNTYGRSKYRNHRLWIEEKVWDYDGSLESGTEYNENGGVVRKYKGDSYNGNETYYRSGRIIGKSSWATRSGVKTTTTEIYLDDVFTRKTVTGDEREEEYIVEKTATGNKEYPQHVRSWKYSTDSVLTAYSNSVYSYDAENRCTLRLDTTLQNGIWTVKRTEYGNGGETVYSKTQEKRPGIDEWITTSETTPEYTFTTSIVQWVNGPLQRTTTKTYRYGFGNTNSIRETWNAEMQKWITDYSSCRYTKVTLGENGEPMSSIRYDGLSNNGTWNTGVIYTFTYNEALQAYERIPVSTTTGGSLSGYYGGYYVNNRHYYNKAGEYLGYFYSPYGENRGFFTVVKKDAYNRTTENIEYVIDINRQLGDTLRWKQFTYFPNDTTADVARIFYQGKDTASGTWSVYQDTKYTKDYSSYSKEGILLYVETYGWEGDEIVLTQTMHHNDVIYDEQGRIKERITYYTANIGYNVPNMRYVYYYRNDEDPKWYGVIQWGSYDRNDETWKSQHVPEYQDYVVLDELQRVVERTTFAMNADKTALRPNTRAVYYYAGDAEDWTTADNYTWNTVKNEFYCSGVSNNAYSKRAEFDEEGNVLSLIAQGGTCERGIEDAQQWAFSYGSSLSEEPVLSPAAYGMKEERVTPNNRLTFSPVADRRIKQMKYTNFNSRFANTTHEYRYTALREGVKEDKMPVSIEPEETSAVFTWGAVEGAETYVLHVYGDAAQTEEICYVVFDNTGKVISINFVRRAPKRYAEVEQFSYTLDGLTAGTQYWYTVTGCDADGKPIESTHGSFRTKGEGESTEGFMEVLRDQVPSKKVMMNGQIYLIYEGRMYDVQGKRVE